MAARARSELDPLEDVVDVAARTGHRLVGANERELGPCMVELSAEVLEGRLRGMAGGAVLAERAFVDVGVAGNAGRREGQKRSGGLMARVALGGDRRVLPRRAENPQRPRGRTATDRTAATRPPPRRAQRDRSHNRSSRPCALQPFWSSAPQSARDTSGTSERSPFSPARGTSDNSKCLRAPRAPLPTLLARRAPRAAHRLGRQRPARQGRPEPQCRIADAAARQGKRPEPRQGPSPIRECRTLSRGRATSETARIPYRAPSRCALSR